MKLVKMNYICACQGSFVEHKEKTDISIQGYSLKKVLLKLIRYELYPSKAMFWGFLMILFMLVVGLQAFGGVPSFDMKDFTSNA